jgi:AmmeMemoRadiSam system protein A
VAYEYRLSEEEERELLRIARATLKEYLLSGRIPPGAPHRESLLAPAGVFVSLHEDGALRGCIGSTQETQPIFRAVQEMAIAAASRDPRFPPVRFDDLAGLDIEISVLGARARVTGAGDVTVGEHGLMVFSPAGQRGLLLPQVATDQGWDAETFLARTCEKAGLPHDFWRRDDATVERFTAQVFGERTLQVGPFAPRS